MKTIETLIAESEAAIGKELTQIILNNDIEKFYLIRRYSYNNRPSLIAARKAAGLEYYDRNNKIFRKYLFDNEPILPAAILAAALGHVDLLQYFGFEIYHTNYSVIKTAIEHGQLQVLEMTEPLIGVSKGVLQDDYVLEQHIDEAITNGDFHILRYLAEQNPDAVMQSITDPNALLSRNHLEAILFLVEIVQLPIPPDKHRLIEKIKNLRDYNKKGVSREQDLLWVAIRERLGLANITKRPNVEQALFSINEIIPLNYIEGSLFTRLLDVSDGQLDNTKVQFAYMYAKGLVPSEMMNEEQFFSLLNSIELKNLSMESIRYLGATFQFMLQETPDSVFTNGDASIETLTKYYAFYSELISGDKEIAKNIFETLPEIERTGTAYFHYAITLLDLHGMKSPDSECQDVLSLAYSALESAVKKGSDLAEKQLTFYQKGLDGSITRIRIPEQDSKEKDDPDLDSYSNFRP